MSFADVSASFLQGLTTDTLRPADASVVYSAALTQETLRDAETSTMFEAILYDPTFTPPPPHWHTQWRFIETRV